jgi:hypothetical protein
MGASALVAEITDHFIKVWPDLETRVLSDQFPDSVELLVISRAFASMSRQDRMELMTAELKSILGNRFYRGLYVVAALTKEEYQKRIDDLPEDNADTGVSSNLKHSAHHTEL